jgi:hypothetical protein
MGWLSGKGFQPEFRRRGLVILAARRSRQQGLALGVEEVKEARRRESWQAEAIICKLIGSWLSQRARTHCTQSSKIGRAALVIKRLVESAVFGEPRRLSTTPNTRRNPRKLQLASVLSCALSFLLSQKRIAVMPALPLQIRPHLVVLLRQCQDIQVKLHNLHLLNVNVNFS